MRVAIPALFFPIISTLLIQLSPAEEPALKQASIKGLLVVELETGGVAGTVSQMNATVVKSEIEEFEVGFNQEVGEMMNDATVEVEKFMRVRHGDRLPEDSRIELAFGDKYTPKDGPSAAVVCALLAESIITGDKIDPGFAATGDMTAAGEVRSIGGLTGKIRGAIKQDCTLIAAPNQNEQSINDIYLIEGIKPLYQIQIFTLETFEDARKIAMVERPEGTQKAIDEFSAVQKVLGRNENFLKNKKVQEKLRNIVKLAPNHSSAKLLYLHSIGRAPKKLSLPGSIDAIDKAATNFWSILEDGSYMDSGNDDVLFKLINQLARMRQTLDKRTIAYCDSYDRFASFAKEVRDRRRLRKSELRDIDNYINRIKSERKKLLNDADVREELMIE